MSYNIKVKSKKQDNSSVTYTFIIGFFILTLSVNLIKLTREYFSKRMLLSNQKKELSLLETENTNLKLKILNNQSRDLIEARARALNLARPNEIVVIIASITPKQIKTDKTISNANNYKLWYKLLFK